MRYRARWVVPISSPPIADGVVAVDGDRIAYVGATRRCSAGRRTTTLETRCSFPGSSTRTAISSSPRCAAFSRISSFAAGFFASRSARRAVLDRDALLDSARYGLEEGMRAGITSFADTCESGVVIQAMREAGVRGVMYQEVFGPDPAQCASSIAELREKVAGLRYLETPARARGRVAARAVHGVGRSLFAPRRGWRASSDCRWQFTSPRASWSGSSWWKRAARSPTGFATRGIRVAPRGRSPIDLLSRLGVLDVEPLLIHCVRVDERDIQTIARSRSPVAHCPASNAKLGHGIAPLTEMLAAGRDGRARQRFSGEQQSHGYARRGATGAAQRSGRARLSSEYADAPATVLELATIGGARAIGIDPSRWNARRGKAGRPRRVHARRTRSDP